MSTPESFTTFQYSKAGLPSDVLYQATEALGHTPPDNAVFVKISYAALNPLDWKLMALVPSFLRKPTIPAQDFAGTILQIGQGVENVKVGDKVFGRLSSGRKLASGVASAAIAEYGVTHATYVEKLAGNMTMEEGVGLMSGVATFWAALVDGGKLREGQSVLIHGSTGGVGMSAVQCARAVVGSTGTVVATCSTASFDQVKSLGSDAAIDYKSPTLYQDLAKYKFNAVMDNVGSQDMYLACPKFTTPDAQYILVGASIGTLGEALGMSGSLLRNKYLPTFLGGTPRKYSFSVANYGPPAMNALREWVAQGKLKAVIDSQHTFDLTGVKSAFAVMTSSRAKGKVLIKMPEA